VQIYIAEMTQEDWPTVAAIYEQGIRTGNATFSPRPPSSWPEWRESKINACSLVARNGQRVVGWAALSPVSKRPVYAGVAEVSVYVEQSARGRGVGTLLLQALIAKSEREGIWSLQARIFPENRASLHLHAKNGFRQVGIQKRLGKMEYGPHKGEWRDVVFVERRSNLAGV
jgi:phosphinothricin acetyltransferase